jgi:hypothetical protein
MIRIKCPKCEKNLAVDDSKAGGIAVCPGCKQRFRIPGARTEKPARPEGIQARPPAPKKEPAADAPRPPARKALRPEESWEREDSSPYVIEKEPEPPVRKRRRIPDDEDEEDDEEDYVRRPVKRKKKKKKRSSGLSGELLPGVSVYMALMGGLAIVWLALGVLMLIKAELGILAILVGLPVFLVGRIWFLVVAYQEGGISYVFFFFYQLKLLFENWAAAGKPFLVEIVGWLMMLTGGIGLSMAGAREHHVRAAPVPSVALVWVDQMADRSH